MHRAGGTAQGAISPSGRTGSLYGIGVIVCAGVVLCAHLSLAIQVRNWTWMMGVGFFLSLCTFFVYNIIAGSVIGANSFLTFDLSGILESHLGQPAAWLTLAPMVTVAMLPRLLTRYILVVEKPIDTDVYREQEILQRRGQSVAPA
jgi:hypothetical protein